MQQKICKVEGEIYKEPSLFSNRNFMLLFFGKLVSQVGDAVYNLAIAWYILEKTKSAAQMAIYMALGTITFIIMGPLGGVIADRIDRKKIIYGMDFMRGAVVGCIGILMYFDIASIWFLYMASVFLSISAALFTPASMAVIPTIVKETQLTKANSLGSMVGSISGMVGTVLGGILYALIGIQGIFILNAVSYILSAISEMFIKLPHSDTREKDDSHKGFALFFKELGEGYDFIKSQKGLYIMMMFFVAINFIAVPILAVYVPYIFNHILKTDPQQLSYVQASIGVGLIIGAMILSIVPQAKQIYKTLTISLALHGVPFAVIIAVMIYYNKGLMSINWVVVSFIIGFTLFGICNSMLNIPITVLFQRVVPNHLLGRVNALLNTLVMAAMPAGMIVGGILADTVPMTILLVSQLVIFMALTGLFWMNKYIKQL